MSAPPILQTLTNQKDHWQSWIRDTSPSTATHGHFAQFYRSRDFLAQSVGEFLSEGILKKEGALIIATLEHVLSIKEAIRERGVDVDLAINSGQLQIFDAAHTLSQFLIEGVPDPSLFSLTVEPTISSLKSNFSGLRVYGEMVGLLWSSGKRQSTIRLEQLWNKLAETQSFALLCGYEHSQFGDIEHAGGYEEICAAHSHVFPSECIFQSTNKSEQLRAIAQLQHYSDILQSELRKRRDAEQALHISESFKKLIVESSPDCISLLDLQGRISFMNAAGIAATGAKSPDTDCGQQWLDLWSADEREGAENALRSALSGEIGRFTGKLPAPDFFDSRWWNVMLSPIRDAGGTIIQILAVSRNITDRKMLELELLEAVRTRDEFLSIASHELKTPITSLKLQFAMRKRMIDRDDPKLNDKADTLKRHESSSRQIDRLARLVEDMLDISRIANGRLHVDREEMNLSTLVRDTVDRFEEQFHSVGCKYTVTTEGSVTGCWDRYRLEQVVINLLTNALKYGGRSPVEISVTAHEGFALFSVRDRGPGLAKTNLERIFQKFERAIDADTVSGLGLGLFICRQVVEAHGGKIWAESEPGQGALFSVKLPLSGAEPLQPKQATKLH